MGGGSDDPVILSKPSIQILLNMEGDEGAEDEETPDSPGGFMYLVSFAHLVHNQ